jgi:hypothetical protein
VNDVEATAEELAGEAAAAGSGIRTADRGVAAGRAFDIARAIAADVAVALVITALIVTTLLFASHVSSFIYIDF